MKTIALIFLFVASVTANAQGLKKVTRANNHFGEVYFVLKGKSNIKQGQYLRYFESMNMYDKSIEAFGNYDNNKKTGAWIFCDAEDNTNPLMAIGEFSNDKKVKRWVYFYSPESDNENVIDLSGGKKHTKVILPKGNEQLTITLDTNGIRTAAVGDYDDGKKVGEWSYYYKNGSLACRYDFSNNIMTYNNGLTTYDQLWGLQRFKSLFHKQAFEKRINNHPFFVQNSNVTFEITTIHDSINILRISSYGSVPFAKTMEGIINKMPLDWINYDPRLEQNKIKVQINYVVNGNIGTMILDSINPLN